MLLAVILIPSPAAFKESMATLQSFSVLNFYTYLYKNIINLNLALPGANLSQLSYCHPGLISDSLLKAF